MRTLRLLLAIGLFAGLFWLAWQFTHDNQTAVSLVLLRWQLGPAPLWGTVLVAFGLGAACAAALLVIPLAQRSLRARRYRKAVAGLEAEIHQLRNLPLAGSDATPHEDAVGSSARSGG